MPANDVPHVRVRVDDPVFAHERKRPMRVLVLGLPRTGTMSLWYALKVLGLQPYHFANVWSERHMGQWTEGLKAKYENSSPWARPDFDRLLGNFDVCVCRSRNALISVVIYLEFVIEILYLGAETEILGKSILMNRGVGTGLHVGWQAKFILLRTPLIVRQSTMDVPTAIFADELIASYPEAKVILSTRDVDAWLASMQRTLFRVFSWPSWKLLALLDPNLTGVYYEHFRVTWQGFCGNDYGQVCRRRFLDHYAHIQDIMPADKLLHYKVADGWTPLCDFLDLAVPDVDFPNVNDVERFMAWHIGLWRMGVRRSIANVLGVAMGALVPAAIAYQWYKRKC